MEKYLWLRKEEFLSQCLEFKIFYFNLRSAFLIKICFFDVIIIFQETGEKLRELRNQIEQKNEELSSLEAENKQLKQDINNQPKVSFDTLIIRRCGCLFII